MTSEITYLTDSCIAIEVPDMTEMFIVDMGYLIYKVVDTSDWITDKEIAEDINRFLRTGKSKFDKGSDNIKRNTGGEKLPEGNWKFLSLYRDIAEEDAAKIVEKTGDGYKDYNREHFLHIYPFTSPKESLQSLFQSKSLHPETTNYAILIKE